MAGPRGAADLDPYDAMPYRSVPVEWTAPERLALVSWLHGGPRPPTRGCRVLEIGSGDGANLLALAWFRRDMDFVGLDAAVTQVGIARQGCRRLGLRNLEFVASDVAAAAGQLEGTFDYILAHGVFSWVPSRTRDALLALCAQRLRPGGLVYLNYNTRPGWNVRGMVRDFLLSVTGDRSRDLRERAAAARSAAAAVCTAMEGLEPPYSRLLAGEFGFVRDSDPSYVAHEFLAPDNHAYWRSEFAALARTHGFEPVADADFNRVSGRSKVGLEYGLSAAGLEGRSLDDTVDLLCYRQLHSPILARPGAERRAPSASALGNLRVASCLAPGAARHGDSTWFEHPTGYQVEAKTPAMARALRTLRASWPGSLPIRNLVDPVVETVDERVDDFLLLHRNGLVELRFDDAEPIDAGPLHGLEAERHGGATDAYHAPIGAVRRSRDAPAALPAI